MKRTIMTIVLIGAVAALLASLFYYHMIAADMTISPTLEYRVSYNRLTKVITVKQINNGAAESAEWRIGDVKAPVFLWSPNGKYLAISATDAEGNSRAEIMDLENGSSTWINTLLDIEISGEEHAQVQIVRWLEDGSVLAEFSYPPDGSGNTAHGTFIFDMSNAIRDLNVSD